MSDRRKLLSRFERIAYWLYGGDDCEIECRQVSAVIARFSHHCLSIYHGKPRLIRPGELCIVERAKVEGKFASAYTCQDCIAKAERDTGKTR